MLAHVGGSTPSVLVCEEALGYQMLARAVLEDAGFAVAGIAASWAEAIELAGAHRPDAVLVDLWLPNFDRVSLGALRAACSGALLAVTSALGIEEASAMLDGVPGIDLVLSKRDPPVGVPVALQAALERRAAGGPDAPTPTAGCTGEQGFEPR
jgi:CheY-like chemotaxis protein